MRSKTVDAEVKIFDGAGQYIMNDFENIEKIKRNESNRIELEDILLDYRKTKYQIELERIEKLEKEGKINNESKFKGLG